MPETETPAAKGPAAKGGLRAFKFNSVGAQFKKQLAELMTQLQMMEPHYIRCIKPNNANRPTLFDGPNVLHQLRCGGVLEAVRISCAGGWLPGWAAGCRPQAAVSSTRHAPCIALAKAHSTARAAVQHVTDLLASCAACSAHLLLRCQPAAHPLTCPSLLRRLPRQAALRGVCGPLLAHRARAAAQRGGRPRHRRGHPQEDQHGGVPAGRDQGGGLVAGSRQQQQQQQQGTEGGSAVLVLSQLNVRCASPAWEGWRTHEELPCCTQLAT